jgi:hypothetical protein
VHSAGAVANHIFRLVAGYREKTPKQKLTDHMANRPKVDAKEKR